MESKLLSTELQNTNDDAMMLFIENEHAKSKIDDKDEPIPIENILNHNIPKQNNIQFNDDTDKDKNGESDDIHSIEIVQTINESKININDTDWDKEAKWYHQIEFQSSMFNVTWHRVYNNQSNDIVNQIKSQFCDKNDYKINKYELETQYNLHSLHPNFDEIDLLPLPRKFVLYSKLIPIRTKQLKFTCNMIDNEMINNIIQKYIALMFEHRLNDDDIENINMKYYFLNVDIYIKYKEIIIMEQDTNESYEIFIPFGINKNCHTIHIIANTIFGVLHAMETLSQLIEYDFNKNIYFIKYIGYIFDYPFYKYRAVSLDTSRHFYSIKSIKKFIDSMIYTKFNVFHWHIVDDQSWPFPLKIYPFVLQNSSWSKYEQYSLNDIYDIISYAKLHGLRVIPEFDSPAHVGSLCRAFDICMNEFCTRSSSGLLDPTKSESLIVIFNIYREIMQIFDDKYIHIGHDEADYKKCFTKNIKLKNWLRENVPNGKKRSKKELGVYYYFLDKTYNFMKNETDKRIIAWDDIWFRLRKKFDIPNDIILIFWRQAWKQKIWEMIKMNFTIIMSEPFYIDLTYNDLKRRYYWDLWMVEDEKNKGNDFKEEWRNNMLGGQACVWSEKIDISVLDAKLFPDLSAISENLWLGGKYTKYNNWNVVKKRLKWHRCLLLKRGIGGSPIDANRSTDLYRRQPDNPGSCYQQ